MEQLRLFKLYLGIIVRGAAAKAGMALVTMDGFSLKFAKMALVIKHIAMQFIKKLAK
jgi:hypothetical protein